MSRGLILVKHFALYLLVSGSVVAQQLNHPLMVSRHDALPHSRPFRTAVDTIRILAVMVQFQQDNTALTSGDGHFDLTQGTDPVIEAPPHNKQYFLDHFTFLANYFRKASAGKVVVQTTVLDSVVTLPVLMQNYVSPSPASTIGVANLARDTWQKVDSAGLVQDFSRFDCFVVLHAGIGHDIDLVSLLGYDPTPYDLPSLFIGLNGFRQYYGGNYPGIAVDGGAFFITNSLVIPEMESRLLPTSTGTSLLELGTNGLLCASLGSYLGLPDLFNTSTGLSGIGRFGLMDGQAIFSFRGTFPPAPSAWERYWLGWIEPVTLQAGDRTISLPAISLPDSDIVYRVPISGEEYFLVENRNRDAQSNGQRVTSVFHGNTRVQTFLRDVAGFNSQEIDSLAGDVTDVDDLDWSLPGGVDENGVFYDGGILIWHIDESVIVRGLQSNGVNADPLHRGVDVEEADGSQDIGQQYGFLDPGSGSEEGSTLDFWFHGNNSPAYRNIFSPASFPNSKSYSGANSHVTVSEFSNRGPHMTARIILGDGVVKLLPGYPKVIDQQLAFPSLTAAPVASDGNPDIIVTTEGQAPIRPSRTGLPVPPDGGAMYAWKADGTPALGVSSTGGLFARLGVASSGFAGTPAVSDLDGNGIPEVVVGAVHQTLPVRSVNAYSATPRSSDSLAQVFFSVPLASNPSTSPVVGDSVVAVGGSSNIVYFLRYDGSLANSIQLTPDSLISGVSFYSSYDVFLVTGSSGTIAMVKWSVQEGARVIETRNYGSSIAGPAVTGLSRPGFGTMIAFATRAGALYVLSESLDPLPHFPVSTGAPITSPPALADVNNDGARDIVVFSGSKVHVYNMAGASLDYFPITVSPNPIASYPVIADVTGDGRVDIIAVSSDGLVAAYDMNGRLAPGFPLQAGTGNQSVAVIDVPTGLLGSVDIGLVVSSSSDGSVSAWKTGSLVIPYDGAKLRPWAQYQRDARHTGLVLDPLAGSPVSSEFFPKDRVYNWPNPVYEGMTHIRYFVKNDATVSIKVFDLAGDLVTTIPNPPGVGGVDNEVEWNVAGIQSGVYFARIEATGPSGSGVAVIKVAVVK